MGFEINDLIAVVFVLLGIYFFLKKEVNLVVTIGPLGVNRFTSKEVAPQENWNIKLAGFRKLLIGFFLLVLGIVTAILF